MLEQVVEIATSVLKPHNRNIEFFDDIDGKDFDSFKKSIEDDGVITPIIVAQDMTIISGHQRYRACVELGIETMPCIIRDDLLDEDDIVRQLIASNLGRIKRNDAKYRKALTEYVKLVGNNRGGSRKSNGQNARLKKNRKEIADELGVSEDELKRQLRISEPMSTG